jgi:parallel beta-helix repeat protein
MGFILDTGDSLAGVNFENNISFANGGSGIAVTNSTNIKLIGNTCFNNFLDPDEKFTYGAVSFANSAAQKNNFVVRNNLLVQTTGRGSIYCFASPSNFTNSVFENNFTSTNAAANNLFMDANNADFRLRDTAASVIGKGTATGIFPTDNGFDPQCVKKVSGQGIIWWQYAPDIAYIISKGGLEHCFNPVLRKTPVDIGAYCKTNSSVAAGSTAFLGQNSGGLRLVVPVSGSPFLTFKSPYGHNVVLELFAINGKLLGSYRSRGNSGGVESVPLSRFKIGRAGLCCALLKQNDVVVAKNIFVSLHGY